MIHLELVRSLTAPMESHILSHRVLNICLMKVFMTSDHFQLGLSVAFILDGMKNMSFYPFSMHFLQLSNEDGKRLFKRQHYQFIFISNDFISALDLKHQY
ncbi:hypothetical protein LOAG_06032 [Loa loa]|uniref:Uncharacterized protein n=1 Tax=Loa loa TaxID=7209 RepID=A0A1S0TYT1_LOALO|nr:hypothetical protein LOAG_06032 [Loa loa]EFO22456.1 hypothetical protein LOAG_06032 [Loa loa]